MEKKPTETKAQALERCARVLVAQAVKLAGLQDRPQTLSPSASLSGKVPKP